MAAFEVPALPIEWHIVVIHSLTFVFCFFHAFENICDSATSTLF